MSKELIELKNNFDEFVAKAEEIFQSQSQSQRQSQKAKAAQPSDQHLLADGWIRHTGDVCPVHELDEVATMHVDGRCWHAKIIARALNWGKEYNYMTHYKVTKKYDPHAENKALYAKDALAHERPWELWEVWSVGIHPWRGLVTKPAWAEGSIYRRKQTKQLVDWSCPLLINAVNTNYGKILDFETGKLPDFIATQQNLGANTANLRLAPPANDKSNWQAYNGEDLNLLHEAGFVVEVKYAVVIDQEDNVVFYTLPYFKGFYHPIASYRVIAIRDGFTNNPKEAK